MGKLRPFVRKDSYMPNKKWIPFVIGNGYTTVDGASGPAPEWETVTGNPVSFNAITPFPLRQLSVAFSPVQSGSGDPSPDNVRPISGWSSLTVEQRGKNLLQVTPYGGSLYGRNVGTDLKDAGGTVAECSVSGNRITVNATNNWTSWRLVATPPLPAGTYTINLGSKPTNGRIYWYITDEDLVVVSQATSAQTKTLLDGQRIAIGLTATPAGEVWFDDVQVELGESYTSSAPINTGRSISISLGQTVYSGYVDVISGVGEVTMASVDMGTLSWSYYDSLKRFAVILSGGKTTGMSYGLNGFCSMYPVLLETRYGVMKDKSMILGTNFFSAVTCAVVVHDETYESKESFKTAMSGVQLVYELATPIPIQLTPQEVSSLLGENVLFSDANGDLTVEYRSN